MKILGVYFRAADWAPYVVIDGPPVTGQNPASSGPAASLLLKQLGTQ
jgi:putative intracellular protease/amidase